jgi:hypothetical protein
LHQGLELGILAALALRDEAQPFSQHLAGVLVATGLHQGFNQLMLVFTQNDVAGGHVAGLQFGRAASPLGHHWHIKPTWPEALERRASNDGLCPSKATDHGSAPGRPEPALT